MYLLIIWKKHRKKEDVNQNYNNKEIVVKNVITPIITHLPISDNSDSEIFIKEDEKDKRISELENQIKTLKSKIKKKIQINVQCIKLILMNQFVGGVNILLTILK